MFELQLREISLRRVLGAGALISAVVLGLRALRRLWQASEVKITGLFVYPIKGCRGHALPCAELTHWGLKGDRTYMVVTSSGDFVTQRQVPRMCLIQPGLPTVEGIQLQTVVPEGPAPLFVPLVGEATCPTKLVKVWSDLVPAVDQGDAAASWLQNFLGQEDLRLVRIADSAHRSTDATFGPGETAFADGFPVLLASQASIDDVSWRSGLKVGADRFRPNIVVTGCSAFEEEEIRSISFEGSAQLSLVKPCSRCTVPTINQSDASRSRGGEPLRTLRRYRSGQQLARTARLHRDFFSEHLDEAYWGMNVRP